MPLTIILLISLLISSAQASSRCETLLSTLDHWARPEFRVSRAEWAGWGPEEAGMHLNRVGLYQHALTDEFSGPQRLFAIEQFSRAEQRSIREILALSQGRIEVGVLRIILLTGEVLEATFTSGLPDRLLAKDFYRELDRLEAAIPRRSWRSVFAVQVFHTHPIALAPLSPPDVRFGRSLRTNLGLVGFWNGVEFYAVSESRGRIFAYGMGF